MSCAVVRSCSAPAAGHSCCGLPLADGWECHEPFRARMSGICMPTIRMGRQTLYSAPGIRLLRSGFHWKHVKVHFPCNPLLIGHPAFIVSHRHITFHGCLVQGIALTGIKGQQVAEHSCCQIPVYPPGALCHTGGTAVVQGRQRAVTGAVCMYGLASSPCRLD